jgi:replicative DNA helicase
MVPIDEMTVGGIAPGEWAIIMAGTGVGKSQFCVNVVHAALMDGQNVFYATTETMAKQILNRLAIRHSRDPKFGVRNGLSSKKLKQHTTENPVLSEEEVLAFHAVITDLTGNPEYGELLITQVSEGTKVSTIEAQAHIFHEQHELGLLVIDSPEMLGADTRRSEERSELNEIANKMKSLALSFNNKKGIPLLTPWQASRAGQERAENSGRYDKRALSDTAMAEKRADLIIGLLENLDNPSKIKGQTLKYRELEGDDFELDIDLDNCYIGSSESLMDVETSYAGLL